MVCVTVTYTNCKFHNKYKIIKNKTCSCLPPLLDRYEGDHACLQEKPSKAHLAVLNGALTMPAWTVVLWKLVCLEKV